MKFDYIFNPFDSPRLNWNLYVPGRIMNPMKSDNCYCLLLDRKSGRVYIKPMKDVNHFEFVQLAGHDAVIAYTSEDECFV